MTGPNATARSKSRKRSKRMVRHYLRQPANMGWKVDPSFIDLSFCSHARSEREPVSGRDLADMTSRLGAHAFSSQPRWSRFRRPAFLARRFSQIGLRRSLLSSSSCRSSAMSSIAPTGGGSCSICRLVRAVERRPILRCICALPPREAVLENDP